MMKWLLSITMIGVLAGVAAAACNDGGGGSDSGDGIEIVLAPASGARLPSDVEGALDEAVDILKERSDKLDLGASKIERRGEDEIVVTLPATADRDVIVPELTRVGLLQLCEPLMDSLGNVAIARQGTVVYQPRTCEPQKDPLGNIVVDGGQIEYVPWPPSTGEDIRDVIVWQQAKAIIDGKLVALDGRVMERNTRVTFNQVTNEPLLVFEWTDEGSEISEDVTERLAAKRLPLAIFLDGEPITGTDGSFIAPIVVAKISGSAQIDGLSEADTNRLSELLNVGPLPLALETVPAGQEGQ